MYHRIIICGNLGSDPIMKYTPDGTQVTSFSMATSRKVKDKSETAWFRVSVWGAQAESCATYLHKGSKVLVEGRLQSDDGGNPRTYQRKDGSWAASFEVRADSVRFMDSKSDSVSSDDVAF